MSSHLLETHKSSLHDPTFKVGDVFVIMSHQKPHTLASMETISAEVLLTPFGLRGEGQTLCLSSNCIEDFAFLVKT